MSELTNKRVLYILFVSPNVLFGSRDGGRNNYRSDATEKEKIARPGYF